MIRFVTIPLTMLLLLATSQSQAQLSSLSGKLSHHDEAVEYATVKLTGPTATLGATTDNEGRFTIQNVPAGNYKLEASRMGFQTLRQELQFSGKQNKMLDLEMLEEWVQLEQVVVTGTRTSKKRTQSPVMVNVIDSRTLSSVQACNLSEGLKFQPGLRVETDCQTCNYTQLRMNGLGGGYSQILINGRPIFSPLTGLYGMEQLPANMIERIEVVRGGGSALYGSSAIGGTVNVITKIPTKSGFDFGHTYQNTGGTNDHIFTGNATAVSKKGNAGATIFLNNRRRGLYDQNGDNFSELPSLKNNSFGTNLFFTPTSNQKIEVNLASLNEYRYGGERVEGPAHLALQSEERTHRVFIGNADYQINFNEDNSSFIAYLAGQYTDREHYTGIFPDDSLEIANHLENSPYGDSKNTTYQGGVQLNHRLQNFAGGSNVMTLGAEYVEDDVLDVIDAYNYKIDQVTRNFGAFLQSDWEITPSLNLLSGVRVDQHNLLNKAIASPRLALMYKYKTLQFRATWGRGFRAPQAFDTDLHIAFAGGGISRISLSDNLREERSNSFSGSVNYDKATENFIAGFTLEGFHTYLKDAFFLFPLGQDQFGERFEKRNGDGATVQGMTLELRANYQQKMQLEAGFTVQTSMFDTPVEILEGLEPRRKFMRTPNHYGYGTFSFFPNKKFATTLNLVYTGKMELPHFAGAPEQTVDEFVTTKAFTELSFRSSYTFEFDKIRTGLELFGGVKNLFNAYQSDFDSGKNRDSNYIYGPAMPRTIFAGIRIKSIR